MIVALAGGVGAARFLQGLVRVVPEENVTVIVNTGDDVELYGLHISPDIDIVMYTLAGIVDEEKGWGIRGDTFQFLRRIERHGYETWFRVGDRDLATHVYRTELLRKGLRLSEVTAKLTELLGLKLRVLPMSDDPVETRVVTKEGEMGFQEYFVKRGTEPEVVEIKFKGIKEAKPAPGLIEAILAADGIVVCPSNPIVSIGSILTLKGVRKALRDTKAPVAGITPIIGGATVKGPADKMMRALGVEVSAYGVADLYRDFLDGFVIDEVDRQLEKRFKELDLRVVVTDTIMKSLEDKVRLAKITLDLLAH